MSAGVFEGEKAVAAVRVATVAAEEEGQGGEVLVPRNRGTGRMHGSECLQI